MKIKSKNFGEIEFPEEAILEFPEGIIGYPDYKRFIIIEDKKIEPFKYLQSVDNPDFALPVINPFLIRKDYLVVVLQEEHQKIGLKSLSQSEPWAALCVVVFNKDIKKSIVNLKAPILINTKEKKGIQVIILTDDYDVEEPLFSSEVLKRAEGGGK